MITTATFDYIANASLSQLVPTATFATIAVGFGASGAMSQEAAINAIAIFLAIFFLSLSVALGVVKLVLSIASMLRRGLDVAASPSLRMVIPILTLLASL